MTLDTLKRYFRWLGILEYDSHPNRLQFAMILKCICGGLLSYYVLSVHWYFIFDAVTFEDYSRSFFFCLSSSLGASFYVTYLMRKKEYADIFDDLDVIIEKSG